MVSVRVKPSQRMTSILDCHLRWKGEGDSRGVHAYYGTVDEGRS
jgi:hypothetical protein